MNTRLRLIGIPISLGLVLAVFILLISTSFTGITLAAPSDPAADVQIQLDDGQAGCCDINGVNSESSETEDSDSSSTATTTSAYLDTDWDWQMGESFSHLYSVWGELEFRVLRRGRI